MSNFRSSPGDEERLKFDPYAHAITVIQEQHRVLHDGFMFHASGKVTGMINANVDDFLFVVPAAVHPHFQSFKLELGRGDVDILIYEGATTSDDGTVQTSFNINRNSANTPGSALYIGPTVTDVGTLIHTGWAVPTGTGTGLSATGTIVSSQGEEWVLKPSTKYLIRVTNNSGATISYRWETLWYELDYDF